MKKLILVLSLLFASTVAFAAKEADQPQEKSYSQTVVWFDLHVSDLDRAEQFYGNLLGWTFKRKSQEGFSYNDIYVNGKHAGSMWHVPGEKNSAGTIVYFMVDDVRAKFSQALSLGAKKYMEPLNIGEGGSAAIVTDPFGAEIGFYSTKSLR